MGKVDDYRAMLRKTDRWEPFLLSASGLPGPRANLELVQAVAEEGDLRLFEHFLAYTSERAPANSPEEFLAVCGVVGLGRLLAEGQEELLGRLRTYASDPRWRVREGVAIALQRLGDADVERLLAVSAEWSTGSPLEQRAAAAAVCEPRLLRRREHVRQVLDILDGITASIAGTEDRKSEAFRVLRQGMAYCWSVAVAASPEDGKAAMEKWLLSADRDVCWIMKENLKKDRLRRMDATWTEGWRSRM